VYSGGNFYAATRCLKTRTHGYFDLFQRYVANNGQVYFHTLRFDGRQYRDADQGSAFPSDPSLDRQVRGERAQGGDPVQDQIPADDRPGPEAA